MRKGLVSDSVNTFLKERLWGFGYWVLLSVLHLVVVDLG